MAAQQKLDKRDDELKLYLAFGKHLLGTDDLHLGYWPEGLDVSLRNLPEAQEHFARFIMSHIPKGTKTILDVGCGIGNNAARLMKAGYEVDGVSPSSYLTEQAHKLLGDSFHVFESTFEELQTDKTYDLILFSESFQYVKQDLAAEKVLGMLNDGGHLLICDFFKTDTEGEGPLSRGPRLSRFYDIVSELPYEGLEDIDITKETAPSMDLADGVMRGVFHPLWEMLLYRVENRWPLLGRILKWKFRKKIERVERKHFSGGWDGEHFRRLKSYRLLLYKKASKVAAEA